MRSRLFAFLALLAAVVLGVVLVSPALADGMPTPPVPHPPAPSCDTTTWGTGPQVVDTLDQGPITAVRAGRHHCYDRLVFDVAGPPVPGWRVAYAEQVLSEGKGDPLDIVGAAKLSINLLHPVLMETPDRPVKVHPHATRSVPPWTVNAAMVDVSRFDTFRSVVFGGSFEGHTQIGLGVSGQLPFRVFTFGGHGHSMIVVDVAHR